MIRAGCWVGLLFLVGCGEGVGAPSAGLARVKAAGVLRWGGDIQGGEPYVSEDPGQPGRLIGFEVEIAEAIATELGVKAEFVQSDWSSLVPTLERGSFDVIMNGLEVTPARAGAVAFTRPYYVFAEQLVVRRGEAAPQTLAELKGKKVGTLANSFAWELLRQAGVEVLPYEGVEEPYQDLEHGRTDAVLLDDVIAGRYGLVKPALMLASEPAIGYYAIGLRPADQDLRRAIDTALLHLAESGQLRRILAKWNLDNPRQERLATWNDRDTEQMIGHPPAARINFGHVALFLEGAGVTLFVSVLAMSLAITLGLGLALTRRYGPKPAALLAQLYVELFRGTPVLLQLYVIYFGLSSLSEHLRLAAMPAAILGLGLNYAAYEAEIYRAGMEAVPPGQLEAAQALGMPTRMALRRIVVPQALRIALPGVTNDFIALLKDSSLVSVITVVELTKRMTITAVDVRSWLIPGLLCAGLYLGMSYPLSRLSAWLEDRIGADA